MDYSIAQRTEYYYYGEDGESNYYTGEGGAINYYTGDSYNKNNQQENSNETREPGNWKSDSSSVDQYPSEGLYEIPGGIPDLVGLYTYHNNVPQRRSKNGKKRSGSKEEKKQEEEDNYLPKDIEIPGPIPDNTSLYRDGLSDSLYYRQYRGGY